MSGERVSGTVKWFNDSKEKVAEINFFKNFLKPY